MKYNLNLKMAINPCRTDAGSAGSCSVSNEYQHLHGIKVDALYVDGAGVHVDRRSIRVSLSRHLMQSGSCKINVSCVKKTHDTHWMMRWAHDRR